ncbi:hypothetical protein PHMEG_0007294 [Phytophthora megakarya]|uniref:Uncharacterized protein n=1 Tax=Phytophthora megakarya TaxID=4795 RepID=A0A225WLN7_9STRA|nr:hypothetical protein PHMEG_0007294 [Phytophthora megakarya]
MKSLSKASSGTSKKWWKEAVFRGDSPHLLIIMMGLSGSGKTTVSNMVKTHAKDVYNMTTIICSADDRYYRLHRHPDMLVTVAFECPGGSYEASQLCLRSKLAASPVEERSFQNYFQIWRLNQKDTRKTAVIPRQVFFGTLPSLPQQ